MANFIQTKECDECIANCVCGEEVYFNSIACKKFALNIMVALKPSHNKQSTPCSHDFITNYHCVKCGELFKQSEII